MAGKKNVEEECQSAMLSQAAVVSDWPEVARLNRKLEDERMFGYLTGGRRCVRRRWEDLHSRASTTPGTGYAETAETPVPADLKRCRYVNVIGNGFPPLSIE